MLDCHFDGECEDCEDYALCYESSDEAWVPDFADDCGADPNCGGCNYVDATCHPGIA